MKYDWKKTEKNFYLPKASPEFIKIPPFAFFTIEGEGDPNDKAFAEYIGVLYSVSYAVKMSTKSGFSPAGYFEYSVYPLEGIWDINEEARKRNSQILDKKSLIFNLMIRQPEFVTPEYASEIIRKTVKKKPHPLLNNIKFQITEDGDCVQMLHYGSYDSESESFAKMEEYCRNNNLIRVSKRHREIYLSDARKVTPDKLKTVLRFRLA